MDKQELQALIQKSGLSRRLIESGIEKLTIELNASGNKETAFNVEIFRKTQQTRIYSEPFMSVKANDQPTRMKTDC